jgi:hypothetical protein
LKLVGKKAAVKWKQFKLDWVGERGGKRQVPFTTLMEIKCSISYIPDSAVCYVQV